MHLLVTTSGLLLLVLVLLVSGGTSQGLFKDLQDLLILDLLVALELLQVDGVGSGQLGETVLGDGYREKVSNLFPIKVNICIPYQWWSVGGRRGCCQQSQRARTGGRRRCEHTRQHRPWRPSRHRAGAS